MKLKKNTTDILGFVGLFKSFPKSPAFTKRSLMDGMRLKERAQATTDRATLTESED